MEGRVIAAHGRQYVVELADGSLLPCFPRGKKSEIACGDRVDLKRTSDDQGVVEAIQPRSSLLYRSNEIRQKLIAANVDQIVIVVATEPAFSDELIARALLAAESEDIAPLIVLNKCDLADKLPAARERLAILAALGYPILELSARDHAEDLRPHLAGKTSVLVGQSGMGKSTLVNALIPAANAATREISQALDSGKHTTTHATLYHLDDSSDLIDSPGLQEFGLGHLDRQEIEVAFREFRDHLGQCRFRDCRHDREPGCSLVAAVASGQIDPNRFAIYHRIVGTRRVA
ncbi:ribosome small subunit-dependent GTPase A [Dechloromonas sp. XY25]|uniref:Small ribosomal subunit biogenesis GTPase RsgA n=1 Tax=Dechloromonas hankyongensis TaxID=2908002 RepID=A0ABS9K510_9RHOO|nr:ribosome small subunit-dependent GTPase A [Dechloromonas hankyongensis]MCG2578266.1 ribosome small subunit-dependent GTPase A [Dechloromonas hankyongensis]